MKEQYVIFELVEDSSIDNFFYYASGDTYVLGKRDDKVFSTENAAEAYLEKKIKSGEWPTDGVYIIQKIYVDVGGIKT